MKEEFVFLTSASESECELVGQRLTEANIKYELREYSEGFVFDLYGGHSPIGKRIFVLNSDLERAKELLGIRDQSFSPSKGKILLILKIGAVAVVIAWVLSVLLPFILPLF
ncbi:MAG: hypothetical protein COX36_00525 [Candidatus Nealsonbacteria bacterium CG23_combo_of_CG06-09_8_20_14_all_38_19]|uniref:DUF2007 domain-containing protein n=1 Tax=Candidatus Nealsonbacteria bacterium CG23_combo_of_CG06-09_8_20_14_all_38_19 TaxID=1974721 RepID=A0A2G9YXG4_9BACT|nr:MAG: hypothetical protein COX36_00525 [Candidatus Nealsonbacteria bacterium CG23_combo_of_CG06-09_8_20_14_all_38_19]